MRRLPGCGENSRNGRPADQDQSGSGASRAVLSEKRNVAGELRFTGDLFGALPDKRGGPGLERSRPAFANFPAIDKVEALGPRHIACGHQNKQLDDDAERTIAETRQYLDDADELLRTESTAVDFFNAKVERYPNHLGRTVLWAGAGALYGVREHPEEDIGQIILRAWL
jgi:hypothetical protein